MSEQFADIEGMLRRALAPVEPPAELEARLEQNLASLVDLATEELEGWEISSMRDPRNWTRVARPVTAVTVGSAAAVGLVLVRTQRKRHKRRDASDNVIELVEHTLRDLRKEAGKLIDDAQKRR
jgi:hypothetical protein